VDEEELDWPGEADPGGERHVVYDLVEKGLVSFEEIVLAGEEAVGAHADLAAGEVVLFPHELPEGGDDDCYYQNYEADEDARLQAVPEVVGAEVGNGHQVFEGRYEAQLPDPGCQKRNKQQPARKDQCAADQLRVEQDRLLGQPVGHIEEAGVARRVGGVDWGEHVGGVTNFTLPHVLYSQPLQQTVLVYVGYRPAARARPVQYPQGGMANSATDLVGVTVGRYDATLVIINIDIDVSGLPRRHRRMLLVGHRPALPLTYTDAKCLVRSLRILQVQSFGL